MKGVLLREAAAEFLGMFVLIAFGSGLVAQVNLSGGSHGGYLSINIAWGLAVIMAIYVSGGVSGAHLNPAVTVALAAAVGFPSGPAGPRQDPRRQQDQRLQQMEDPFDCDADQPERRQEEPDQRIGDQRHEGERPAQDQQDQPEQELRHRTLHLGVRPTLADRSAERRRAPRRRKQDG
jgi:hypothetical protein